MAAMRWMTLDDIPPPGKKNWVEMVREELWGKYRLFPVGGSG